MRFAIDLSEIDKIIQILKVCDKYVNAAHCSQLGVLMNIQIYEGNVNPGNHIMTHKASDTRCVQGHHTSIHLWLSIDNVREI